MTEIVIANTAEAFANLLERTPVDPERALHERDLAGRALFWGGHDKVVVASEPIDPHLVAHTARLLRCARLEVWHPSTSTLRLCADILADSSLLKRLLALTEDGATLLPYAVTPEFCILSERLDGRDRRQACRAMAEVDSKAGFRRLFEGGRLSMPVGWACASETEVVGRADELIGSGSGAVVKAHDGESGWGMAVLSDRQGSGAEGTSAVVATLFASDPIWSHGPYIVEEFIHHDRSQPGFSPSGEATVTDDGVVFDFVCDQIIAQDGEFGGVRIGASVESGGHADAVRCATLVVGEELRMRSYRGTFDVDFVVDSEGGPLAVESNVRLTGGTHVHGAARALFGEGWRERAFASNDAVTYGGAPLSARDLMSRLGDLMLRPGGQRGLLFSFVSARRPVAGLIAVGKDHDDASSLLEAALYAIRTDSDGPL
ncbi:MAG: hypothetical protein ABI216_06125 [Devosia sp.]